jgi:hypothetical protein
VKSEKRERKYFLEGRERPVKKFLIPTKEMKNFLPRKNDTTAAGRGGKRKVPTFSRHGKKLKGLHFP